MRAFISLRNEIANVKQIDSVKTLQVREQGKKILKNTFTVDEIAETEVAEGEALRMTLYSCCFTPLNGKLLKVQSKRTFGGI